MEVFSFIVDYTEVNENAQKLLRECKKRLRVNLLHNLKNEHNSIYNPIFIMLKVFGNNFLPLTYDFHCATTYPRKAINRMVIKECP